MTSTGIDTRDCDQTETLVIDAAMPVFDVSIAEHLIVRSDGATTFAAIRALDFLSVHTPLLDSAMWIRGLPTRLRGRPTQPPPRLVLAEGDPLPGWLLLGEQPGREIAFGAVGRFWKPDIEWRDIDPQDFAEFSDPGWGKIAATLVVTPYGARASVVTYECRTMTTDDESRQRFLRYWTLIRPFVGHIFRATVQTIGADAEARR